jgi:hypothetical protein
MFSRGGIARHGAHRRRGRRIPCVWVRKAPSRGFVLSGFLDTPHFTRLRLVAWRALSEVLLSVTTRLSCIGGGVKRFFDSSRRPDDLIGLTCNPTCPAGAYVALLHHTVLDRRGNVTHRVTGSIFTTSLEVCHVGRAAAFCVFTLSREGKW